ncbi:hypothetical protein LSAT2_001715 [Lamellibrachia satsuma]|nr:hypothetical protein LSAT2_001715 [Lamellibrachia satsuma]
MPPKKQKSTTYEEIIAEFRERVTDILQPHHDDHFLSTWLRARHFDLDKAEDMLRKVSDFDTRVARGGKPGAFT